jgi:uncharacterized protein (TIGR02246 family)
MLEIRMSAKALSRLLMVVLAISMPLGLRGAPSTPCPHPAATPADAAIAAANSDWLPAMRRSDAVALAAPYATDGLFVTVKGEVIRGREAVQQLYEARFATLARVVGGDIVSECHVQTTESLVYEWGHASISIVKKDGTSSSGGGPFLTVWHLGDAGRWEIVRNIVF